MGDRCYSEKHGREFHHLTVAIPEACRRPRGRTEAQHHHEYECLCRALERWSPAVVSKALAVVASPAFQGRRERLLAPLQWFASTRSMAGPERWAAVAVAPAGHAHLVGGIVGVMLDRIAEGRDIDDVLREQGEMMRPDRYMRPTAKPTAHEIDAAERLVESLGLARSLERRYARLADVVSLWRPVAATTEAARGVFARLRDDKSKRIAIGGSRPITFERFASDVMPIAEQIAVLVPRVGAFFAFVDAVHADAPPVLQWDRENRRNAASMYTFVDGSPPSSWFLAANSWARVMAIADRPAHWHGESTHHPHAGMFVLEGAAPRHGQTGGGLFPEELRSELHPIRRVVEAYANATPLAGAADADACGIFVGPKGPPLTVRVASLDGIDATYVIDRLR